MRGRRNVTKTPRSILVAAVAFAAVLTSPLGRSAFAEPVCSYDSEIHRLNVTLAPADAVTLSVGAGSTVLVNDVPCATIGIDSRSASRIAVRVGDVPADESVTVSQAGVGRFPDGYPIEVNLGEGAFDRLVVVGGESAETFGLDGRGMVVPLQVAPVGVDLFEVDGGGGNDTVDAGRSDIDLGSFDHPIEIHGGSGDDALTGGPESDRVAGDDGNDRLDGGAGLDRLNGGAGSDTCVLDLVSRACDPSISLQPTAIGPVGSLALAGAGWYPENGDVGLSFASPDGGPSQPLTPLVPDAGWSIGTTLVAPSPTGSYSLVACQPCSDPEAERAIQAFTVQPPAGERTVTVAPGLVAVGDLVVVSGDGWDRTFGPVSLLAELPGVPAGRPFATVSAGDNGHFERDFEIPQLAVGAYEVTACQQCDEPGAIVETASFTVRRVATAQTLELRPPHGVPGDRLRAVGAGWDPDRGRVRIFVDPSGSTSEPDAVVRIGADGIFEEPLDVPDLGDGSYTVLACQRCNGPARAEATATLTVPGSAASPWWWIALGSVLLIAAIGGLSAHRVRARRRVPPGRIGARLRPADPEIHVVPVPDGSLRHSVRLVPRADPGVQQIREGSPR